MRGGGRAARQPYRSIFPRVVPDDPVAPRVPTAPFGDVVDLAVDDKPFVGAQVVPLNLLPAEGWHRGLALGGPLALVAPFPHAACPPTGKPRALRPPAQAARECRPGPAQFGFCLLLLLPPRPLPQPPRLRSGVSPEYPRLPTAPKRSPSPPLPPPASLRGTFASSKKLRGCSGPRRLRRPPLRLPPPAAPHPPAFAAAGVSTVISRAPAPIRARRPACHWPRRIFRRPEGQSGSPRLPHPPARSRATLRTATCLTSSLSRGCPDAVGDPGGAAPAGRAVRPERVRAPLALPGFALDAGTLLGLACLGDCLPQPAGIGTTHCPRLPHCCPPAAFLEKQAGLGPVQCCEPCNQTISERNCGTSALPLCAGRHGGGSRGGRDGGTGGATLNSTRFLPWTQETQSLAGR